ncbi:MAG TPA: lipid A export permease/ATP-binding protein MsbA [Desulfurivibrio alkaliphilus]|uniref:Lipid A export permease/ATP-binding protein MsbA n=1 Tax=Desulfurivibrio alkaliphilus TaxID=427923 RepID=A0A7C2TJL7_9BACT|nr:lipid A export permease/ATP-binding protein MsbA [Desulfurivibrio alkaliphilus]
MNDKELLLRIYQWIKPYRRRLCLAMIGMIMVAGFSGAQAYMIKPLLDKIFFEQDRTLLNLLPLILILIFLFKGIFYYVYRYLLDTVGQNVVRDLRKEIFRHIHALPVAFFHQASTGELISRVISDVTLIQSAVSKALVSLLRDLVQVVVLLGVVFYLDWQMALVTFVLLPVAAVPIVHFGKRFRRNSVSNQQTVALISGALHETIGGHRIVKAFGMEAYEHRRFFALIDRLYKIIVKEIQIRSLQHPVMELIGGIALAGIIWYGGHQVLAGDSTPGTFIAFLTALVMVYEPVKGISSLNSEVMQGLAASTRVFNLLDVQPDIVDRPGAVELPAFRRAIEFQGVTFSYDGKNPVLRDLNLTVAAGQVLAIVGPSGGGKTTLVNLIPRFFEVSEGRILLDGHDLRDVTLASLRAQIAIVEQHTVLFNDTIRNNIAYGDPERSEEEIIAAAKAAHAYDFIRELPEEFETVIGEGGARLSGGQRQRLSIARALLKNAPILILDEATSALDTESEREVQKALENLMANRTTLVIAHRLSTIKNADRIIVMQEGRIVEDGDHESLLQGQGLYRTLHTMQ